MKAIILAAGSGIKMRERTEAIPTCLMKIGKETLLQRQINILKKLGINEIVVIIGKEGDCWTQQNINKIKGIAKNVLINPKNSQTPSSSSLILGLNYFKPSNCLILDGDLVFEEGIIKAIIKNKSKRVLLIEKANGDLNANFVKLKECKVELISRKKNTDKKYTGLMKIDNVYYKKFQKDLVIIENQNREYSEFLNNYLKNYPLNIQDIEELDGEKGEIFNFKPLTGGSFANTKVMSKLIEKTYYVVKKEASSEGRAKLIDEIIWIKNLPLDLSAYFPRILDYEITKKLVWYEMEYCALPTLRQLLIDKKITFEQASYILKTLIKIMFSKFYSKKFSKNPSDYYRKIHLQRIKERFVTTAQMSKLMKKIIEAKYLIINGEKLLNLPHILNLIEKDENLLKKLDPPFLCKVHGDLHFDNFVVDMSQMPMVKFILLDPRGLDNTYSYCYDLGKLWHSFHGKYDLIHEGLFDLTSSFEENNFVAKINYTDKDLFFTYESLYKNIKEFLGEMPSLKEDPFWELRTCFSEMAHFCSVMPFHIKHDEKEKIAIALYIRGVKLANELISKYGKARNYVNINSLKDYYLAKKIFEQNGKKNLKIEKLNGGTFNQKIFKIIEKENGLETIIIRKESNQFNSDLIKEIQFLNLLNSRIKKNFCEVKKFQIDTLPVFYEMPFYNMQDMGQNIIKGEKNSEYYLSVLSNILNFMFKEVFSKNEKNTSKNYLDKTIFSRINERYKQLKKISPILKNFIEAKKIIINGKEYQNIPQLLENIKREKNLLEKLTPKKTHMIHGDFHFGNFLINNKDPSKFILIDPRGEINDYAYTYDLGKLWFSFHGKYDLIHKGLFNLNYSFENKKAMIDTFEYTSPKAVKIFNELYDKRKLLIDICKKYLSEDNIEEQILFSEATHFCAIAPFNLKNDGIEKEAVGRYLTAVKLLNEFMNNIT